MKRISLIFIIFILMTSCLTVNIQATEGEVPVEVTAEAATPSENDASVEESAESLGSNPIIESKPESIETRGVITEAGEVITEDLGAVKNVIQQLKVKITEGEYKGEEYTTIYVLSYDIEGKIVGYEMSPGDKVIVQIVGDESGNVTATVIDFVRSGYITVMFILFLISVVLVGGKKGIKAILALLATILLIYFMLVRFIYNGYNAILSSIGTAALIIIVSLVIIGGINKKILTAAIGTLGGVVSAGLIATIFNYLAKMSGACEEAIQLSINMTTINFNFKDLLFAGIIIAALGASMDVGMSIASSLDEIKTKLKDITWKELFKSGMNIGKDIIGTMSNTLILAYVGGSITLILLFMACNMSIGEILNKETIIEEIILAIAGTMGVIYTVPITAFTYAMLNRDKTIYKTKTESRLDGQRSLKL